MKNIVHLYITDHCSTHCPFCGMGSGPSGSRYLPGGSINELIVPLLSESSPNLVRLLGGEPLSHPEFNDILENLLSNSGVSKVEIITNGIGVEDKMSFICEMIDRYKKPIMIRFSINYWLLSANAFYKEDKMQSFLKKYQRNNLEFSTNIGVRNLPEDREILSSWQKVFGSLGNRVVITHLAAYTDEIEKECPGLYKKRTMICPHFDAKETFINPEGKLLKNCDDLSLDMQNHSKYYEK